MIKDYKFLIIFILFNQMVCPELNSKLCALCRKPENLSDGIMLHVNEFLLTSQEQFCNDLCAKIKVALLKDNILKIDKASIDGMKIINPIFNQEGYIEDFNLRMGNIIYLFDSILYPQICKNLKLLVIQTSIDRKCVIITKKFFNMVVTEEGMDEGMDEGNWNDYSSLIARMHERIDGGKWNDYTSYPIARMMIGYHNYCMVKTMYQQVAYGYQIKYPSSLKVPEGQLCVFNIPELDNRYGPSFLTYTS